MFKSARVKLTLFYLAAILIISLMLTFGSRWLAGRAILNNSETQQPALRAFIRREVGLPLDSNSLNRFVNTQRNSVDRQLDVYVIEINLVVFVVGGFASWWFAGRALRPLEEAHLAQTRFAADASHELKTPLTAMRTENEVFLRLPQFSHEEAKDQLKSNLEEVNRLESLVNNLLLLSSYGYNVKPKKSKIEASEVIEETLIRFKKQYPTAESRIKVRVKSKPVKVNRDSISQILLILLDNAIKYSPANSNVELIGRKHDNHYQFIVEDHGPGIKENDMPYIFDRLYRGDKARAQTVPGHGLGLSLAREIAKVNGAGLRVANVYKGGARFTVSVETA